MNREDLKSIEDVAEALRATDYIADRQLATSIFLALKLGKPLFLEGEPGVGKTEVARALTSILGLPLLRLQCWEGLDLNDAVYEWNYAKQLLALRSQEALGAAGAPRAHTALDLYAREYLIPRPLLQAIDPAGLSGRCVLLIDELDRADEEFEAFLLEVLADFQITIPELGTLRAGQPPIVILTSNRTREIHDALKRRCLYQWIDFPTFDKELEILRRRAPEAASHLTEQVVAVTQALREEDLFKKPGIAESIDWLAAILALDHEELSDDLLKQTLGVLLKYQDDIERFDEATIRRLLDRSRARQPAAAMP